MALSESIGKGAPQFSHFSFISSIKNLHSSRQFPSLASGLPGRKTQSAIKENKPHTAPPKQIAAHPPVAQSMPAAVEPIAPPTKNTPT